MATGPFKVVFFFKDEEYGSTETYVNNASSWDSLIGTATSKVQIKSRLGKLLSARLGILNGAVKFVRARVNDLANPGQLIILAPPEGFERGRFLAKADQQEDWTDLLCLLQAGFVTRRRLTLMGIPTAISDPAQQLKDDPAFSGKFSKFEEELESGSWVILSRPLKGAATPITGFVVAASGTTATVTTAIADPGIPQFNLVIRGLKTPYGWNGVHHAKLSEAGVFIIGPTKHALPSGPPFVVAPGQTAQVFAYRSNAITDVSMVRIVDKKRGGPFGRPRGKR